MKEPVIRFRAAGGKGGGAQVTPFGIRMTLTRSGGRLAAYCMRPLRNAYPVISALDAKLIFSNTRLR